MKNKTTVNLRLLNVNFSLYAQRTESKTPFLSNIAVTVILLNTLCILSLSNRVHAQTDCGSTPYPTMATFDQQTGGGTNCTSAQNLWVDETGQWVGNGPNAMPDECVIYSSIGNTCDNMIWAYPIDFTQPFTLSFELTQAAGGEGMAFTFFNAAEVIQATGQDFPCSTPYDCDGSGASNPSAVGGNLGYSPVYGNTAPPAAIGTQDGGSLTVEFDLQNDTPIYADGPAGCLSHVSIVEDACLSAPVTFDCLDDDEGPVNINDGLTDNVQIIWNPNTDDFYVTVDGTVVSYLDSDVYANYFFGGDNCTGSPCTPQIYLAISTGTAGGATDYPSSVCNASITNCAPTTLTTTLSGAVLGANCITPLPIELTTFEGALNNRVIDLSWTTASESNNDYFIVKRSFDGTNWNGLENVNGAGNHQGELNYVLTDVDFDPAYNAVYYALSQVDYDGTISQERKIAVSLVGLWNQLTIFPNPTSEMLHVKFKSNEQREQLMLVDMVGKDHLSSVQIETFGKESEIAINVSSLTDGIYFIVYGTERLKFVKTETKD